MFEPTIRQLQLTILYGAVAIVAVLGTVGGIGVTMAVGASNRVSESLLPAREANSALLRNMLDRESGIRAYLVTEGPTDLTRYAEATTEAPRRESELRDLLADEPGLRDLVETQEQAIEAWTTDFAVPVFSGEGTAVSGESGLAEANRLIDDVRSANSRLATELNASIKVARADSRQATMLLLAVLGVLGVAALVVSWRYLRRAMSALRRPLGDLEQMAHRLSAGEHGVRVSPQGLQEVQHVARALNRLADENERGREMELGVHARLVELDRTRQEFVSNVSHELRTPLTNIYGYLELLHDALQETGSAEEKEMLDASRRNVERLRELIEDLLYLNKAEAVEEPPRVVDVRDVVADVVADVRVAARKRGVQVSAWLPDGELPVSAVPSQLFRALLNLAANAVKFSHRGGRVAVSIESEGDMAVIRIRDDGIGIPAAELGQLGSRFFRASNAVRGEIAGTGLGVRISQTILTNAGGSVDFDSREGHGTTALARIPLVKGGVPEPTVPPAEPREQGVLTAG